MDMNWTVSERPALCDGEPQLTVFEISESSERAVLVSAQSSEHCPGYGWTADELRERVRLMAAAPALRDALELALLGLEAHCEQGGPLFIGDALAADKARAALALLEAQEVEA